MDTLIQVKPLTINYWTLLTHSNPAIGSHSTINIYDNAHKSFSTISVAMTHDAKGDEVDHDVNALIVRELSHLLRIADSQITQADLGDLLNVKLLVPQ